MEDTTQRPISDIRTQEVTLTGRQKSDGWGPDGGMRKLGFHRPVVVDKAGAKEYFSGAESFHSQGLITTEELHQELLAGIHHPSEAVAWSVFAKPHNAYICSLKAKGEAPSHLVKLLPQDLTQEQRELYALLWDSVVKRAEKDMEREGVALTPLTELIINAAAQATFTFNPAGPPNSDQGELTYGESRRTAREATETLGSDIQRLVRRFEAWTKKHATIEDIPAVHALNNPQLDALLWENINIDSKALAMKSGQDLPKPLQKLLASRAAICGVFQNPHLDARTDPVIRHIAFCLAVRNTRFEKLPDPERIDENKAAQFIFEFVRAGGQMSHTQVQQIVLVATENQTNHPEYPKWQDTEYLKRITLLPQVCEDACVQELAEEGNSTILLRMAANGPEKAWSQAARRTAENSRNFVQEETAGILRKRTNERRVYPGDADNLIAIVAGKNEPTRVLAREALVKCQEQAGERPDTSDERMAKPRPRV